MSRKNVCAILSFFMGISIFYLAFRDHSDPESASMISIDCGGGIVLIIGYFFGRHRGSNVLFKAIMIFKAPPVASGDSTHGSLRVEFG